MRIVPSQCRVAGGDSAVSNSQRKSNYVSLERVPQSLTCCALFPSLHDKLQESSRQIDAMQEELSMARLVVLDDLSLFSVLVVKKVGSSNSRWTLIRTRQCSFRYRYIYCSSRTMRVKATSQVDRASNRGSYRVTLPIAQRHGPVE